MYYFYIDESGVEELSSNPAMKNPNDDWFTSGGIIVHENSISNFEAIHNEVIEEYFVENNIELSDDFRLHYTELRENRWPYSELSETEIWKLTNKIFDGIKKIDCKVISSSINKKNHLKKDYPYTANVRSYSLLLCLERFQYFLEEKAESGIGVYERFTNRMRRNMTNDLQNLQQLTNFSFFSNLDKIKKKIKGGDPIEEKVLQFSDFFIYAPQIRLVSNYKKERRFLEIENEYYNLDGKWNEKGYVVIN